MQYSICVCVCVCLRYWVRKVRKNKSKSRKSVRQTWQTESTTWQRTQTLHLLILLFSPQPGQTVSNNSEHLGSLQALHLSPWGSSPGTGGPTQLSFLLESCLEQADYRSSPRRDMRPGILSNSFTLIIRKDWQWGKNTDTYRKRSTKFLQCQKVNFLKSYSETKVTLTIHLTLFCFLWFIYHYDSTECDHRKWTL